ncbi:MAG: glycosyltransferase [Butyrivibrio sp.]
MDKILVLFYRAPYPVTSGDKIRAFQNIMMLSEKYDIDLLYIDDNEKNINISGLKTYCKNIIKYKNNIIKSFFNAVSMYLFRKMPLQVGFFYNKKMQKWIDKNIEQYNMVFCNHIRTFEYVRKHKNIIKITDAIDAISMNYLNKVKVSLGIKKFIYKLEIKHLIPYEKRVYEESDATMIISERDKDFIEKIGVKKVPYIVYNYARNLGYNYDYDIMTTNISSCFMGKLNYEPNVNAMSYFANKIFPKVKEKYPEFQFYIMGQKATNEINNLDKIDGINVLGYVDNPAEIIGKCRVVIAPMVSGSGLQNKIIESMYLGKTVITTEIGADGLARLTGKELVISNSTEAFINNMIYYLSEENLEETNEIGKNAREYVLSEYSYEAVSKQFNSVFDNIERSM